MKTTIFTYLLTSSLLITSLSCSDNDVDEEKTTARYKIEGKVYLLDPPFTHSDWQANTKLHVNGGQYLGFLKKEGSFIIHNIPIGSHILEVINSEYSYEPVRVEINAKGKLRARQVNHVHTSQVIPVPYPLKMKPLGKTKYFEERENWGAGEFLLNPMVLTMLLPLLIVMVIPKLLDDLENKKEMAKMGSLSKFEMPKVSERVTNFLTGPPEQIQQQSNKKNLKTKKRQ